MFCNFQLREIQLPNSLLALVCKGSLRGYITLTLNILYSSGQSVEFTVWVLLCNLHWTLRGDNWCESYPERKKCSLKLSWWHSQSFWSHKVWIPPRLSDLSFAYMLLFLTHWRPIPIHYRDQSFLHCRPIPIVYRDQCYIFFLFRTIPDTVSGLGFSVCYLLLSFHSKFRSGGVHSFYFTKLLRNPTQLHKLLLTIS